MKKTYIISLIAVSLVAMFSACDSDPNEEFIERIVVQGTMYTGQPMQIDLTKSIYWNHYYDADSVRLTNAVVQITVDNGTTYDLTEANSGIPGTYKAPEDAPLVTQGSKYDLHVEHEGRIVTASTTAVSEFVFDSISVTSTDPEYPDTIKFFEDVLYAKWALNPADFGYAILIENLEPNWDEEEMQTSDDLGPAQSPISSGVVQDHDDMEIPWYLLMIKGKHRFRMYSCDQALWDYFGTNYIGDADNEPVSNVEGGLGIFCAVGADTAYFYLTSDLGPED